MEDDPGAEVHVSWNAWIRRTHRWLSIVFTATVLANFAAMTRGRPPAWVTYSPLFPLALLLLTGLYMFALPYVAGRRSAQRTD
jgi:cellulose synthase/poly-beta-1,6-N-acetylglucosamine synthase-like glycosyltransferase